MKIKLSLLFLFLTSYRASSKEDTLYEKSAGNAFSVYSDVRSSYRYNPSILDSNKDIIISPFKLKASTDSSFLDFLQNREKYKKLKGQALVSALLKIEKGTPNLNLDLALSSLLKKIALAIHFEAEANIKVRDEFITSLEIAAAETVKMYFSHGFHISKFSFGYTIKPSYSILYQTKQNAVTYNEALLNPNKHGTKKTEIFLTLGGSWQKKIARNHKLIVGTTFNNIGIELATANRRDNWVYKTEPFKYRIGAGVISFLNQYIKTKAMNTFETNLYDSFSNHLGFSLKFIDLLDLRLGFENLSYSLGFFVIHDFIEAGFSFIPETTTHLLANQETRNMAFTLNLSIPFSGKKQSKSKKKKRKIEKK